MNLVRHGYEDDKGKDIALPRTRFIQCFWGKGNKFVCHVCQWDQRHEAVVSVGLYEIMPGNCCRVNMMFSKGSDESLRKQIGKMRPKVYHGKKKKLHQKWHLNIQSQRRESVNVLSKREAVKQG